MMHKIIKIVSFYAAIILSTLLICCIDSMDIGTIVFVVLLIVYFVASLYVYKATYDELYKISGAKWLDKLLRK